MTPTRSLALGLAFVLGSGTLGAVDAVAASRTAAYVCDNRSISFFLRLSETDDGAPGRTAAIQFLREKPSILMRDPQQDGVVYENTDYRVRVLGGGAVEFSTLRQGRAINKHRCN